MYNLIISSVKGNIKDLLDLLSSVKGYFVYKSYYKSLKDIKKVFIFDVPKHGNLGDQAIIYAEREVLNKLDPGRLIIEITTAEVAYHIRAIKKYCNTKDVFFLHGGGNLGAEYFAAERARRLVIKHIRKNNIILFPQTMDFRNTKWGVHQLKKSIEIYGGNSNLTLTAREHVSYKLMKKNFPKNNVILTPDIVLFLTKQESLYERSGGNVMY